MPKESAIEVSNLTKYYGKLLAVDHVDFVVKGRELFGLLGPNGAGKTTTIRMICGMLRPTSGTIVVAGFNVSQKLEVLKRRFDSDPAVANQRCPRSGSVNLEFMG